MATDTGFASAARSLIFPDCFHHSLLRSPFTDGNHRGRWNSVSSLNCRIRAAHGSDFFAGAELMDCAAPPTCRVTPGHVAERIQ